MVEQETQTLLTREGYDELQKKLDHLVNVRRVEIVQQLHEATQDGDGMENEVLESTRNELAVLESRIREIEAVLGEATVLDDSQARGDRVTVGSYVTVVDTEEGTEAETYRIVASVEADPLDGKISNESPLGQALLGRRVMETVTIAAPQGEQAFRIVEVR